MFVTVDSQGWFAEPTSRRTTATAATTRAGGGRRARRARLRRQRREHRRVRTHSHAAPTIMGIWGHTDPEYLHAVKRRLSRPSSRRAVERPHEPSCGRRPARSAAWSPGPGHRSEAGFAVDTQMPILWARQPGTGATIATYADVPIHADQYNPTAAGNNQFSADYPGWVRDRLAQLLGGTDGGRRRHARPAGEDRQRRRLRRGRPAGALRHERDDRARSPTHARSRTRRCGRQRAVLDRGREHGPARGDVLQPPRRPARLPGPAESEPAGNNGRARGTGRSRRDLHDQPLADAP